ncbi:YvrJ family protein [Aciduricibacillus chroicocephali]|uniref:YvrJ family protein n=1 Tax=Aciduricibacillus chroicocephali TaxID=3054939 RepID=A0ABY9KUD5_9BACI|nr:YvrJ family protein [Bacillaceae bacterium 44XB]
MDTSWATLVTDVGFPIMVTFYLLHRIEGKMNVLIESVRKLPDKMQPFRPV